MARDEPLGVLHGLVGSRRPVAAATGVAAVLALWLGAGVPASGEPPRSQTQPLVDGCQRNNTMLLATAAPEWVYVNRAQVLRDRLAGDATAGAQRISGTVTDSRVAGEDFYLTHDYNDYNLSLVPDPGHEDLLGDNADEMHLEWEAPAVPLWAWPAAGDRVVAAGAWIWDCGHWGNSTADPTGISQFLPFDPVETARDLADDSAIRGEGTELHPMHELAAIRASAAGIRDSDGAVVELSRADVWISSDGGPALQMEECHLYGMPVWGVARAACPRYRDVGGTYTYTLSLGEPPSAGSEVFVDPVVVHSETTIDPTPSVTTVVDRPARHVIVSFTLPQTRGLARFGITVEAGWSDAAPAVKHNVRLEEIQIERSLDGESEPNLNPGRVPAEQTPEPGEWVLYASVSGHWVQLPGLQQVTDGQTIPLGIDIELWLPQGVTPRLFVTGHECDVPLVDCSHETFGSGAEDAVPFTETGFNDRPGRVHTFRLLPSGALVRDGVAMTPGSSGYAPPTWTGGPDEDSSDGTCGAPQAPAPCYRLTATWTVVS